MRKLKFKDVPAFCRCLKRLGIKDQIQSIAKDTDKAADAWKKGFDLVYGIFDLATEKNGEKELYEFLAPIFEMTPQELEDMDVAVALSLCKQLAEENDLASFFGSAVKSMK